MVDIQPELAAVAWASLASPAEIVMGLRGLGARLKVIPPDAHDPAEWWTFSAKTNLDACRKVLKLVATFQGRGWCSAFDMHPGKAVHFGDNRFNSAFCAAIREARRCH